MKDARPLRADEPAAFFELDDKSQMTFDVEFKRPCRYIMLKPTGFRSKPTKYEQSMDTTPVEIEFFGAIGETSEENSLDAIKISDSAQNDTLAVNSGFDIEVRLMGSNEVISTMKDVKIN
jgi:hypothetical protein